MLGHESGWRVSRQTVARGVPLLASLIRAGTPGQRSGARRSSYVFTNLDARQYNKPSGVPYKPAGAPNIPAGAFDNRFARPRKPPGIHTKLAEVINFPPRDINHPTGVPTKPARVLHRPAGVKRVATLKGPNTREIEGIFDH